MTFLEQSQRAMTLQANSSSDKPFRDAMADFVHRLAISQGLEIASVVPARVRKQKAKNRSRHAASWRKQTARSP
jgi:hypothetical protein